jgi:uncharacterized membrane protein
MRRFRLSGWQRIGIVLSVVWLVVGFVWARHLIYDPIYASDAQCLGSTKDWSICDSSYKKDLAIGRDEELGMFAIVALAPIPIAWLLAYGIVALVRWIRRGFQPST